MSLTIIVTRDVQGRYRGFLGSLMLELAPGVYISPRMNKAVRERVWSVMETWYGQLKQGAITLVWSERGAPGGVRVCQLGESPKGLVESDGLLLACRKIKQGTLSKNTS